MQKPWFATAIFVYVLVLFATHVTKILLLGALRERSNDTGAFVWANGLCDGLPKGIAALAAIHALRGGDMRASGTSGSEMDHDLGANVIPCLRRPGTCAVMLSAATRAVTCCIIGALGQLLVVPWLDRSGVVIPPDEIQLGLLPNVLLHRFESVHAGILFAVLTFVWAPLLSVVLLVPFAHFASRLSQIQCLVLVLVTVYIETTDPSRYLNVSSSKDVTIATSVCAKMAATTASNITVAVASHAFSACVFWAVGDIATVSSAVAAAVAGGLMTWGHSIALLGLRDTSVWEMVSGGCLILLCAQTKVARSVLRRHRGGGGRGSGGQDDGPGAGGRTRITTTSIPHVINLVFFIGFLCGAQSLGNAIFDMLAGLPGQCFDSTHQWMHVTRCSAAVPNVVHLSCPSQAVPVFVQARAYKNKGKFYWLSVELTDCSRIPQPLQVSALIGYCVFPFIGRKEHWVVHLPCDTLDTSTSSPPIADNTVAVNSKVRDSHGHHRNRTTATMTIDRVHGRAAKQASAATAATAAADNVLVLLLDSVSWHRVKYLPRMTETLAELHRTGAASVAAFPNYIATGLRSIGTQPQIMSGLNSRSLHDLGCLNNSFCDLNLLSKAKALGYQTLHADMQCWMDPSMSFFGFHNRSVELNADIAVFEHSCHSWYKPMEPGRTQCVAGRIPLQTVLDKLGQYYDGVEKGSSPSVSQQRRFAWVVDYSGHEPTNYRFPSLDQILSDWLATFVPAHPSTAIVLLSDHGVTYDCSIAIDPCPSSATEMPTLDKEALFHPFMYVIVPTAHSMHTDRDLGNLHQNSAQGVTALDVHATIMHMMSSGNDRGHDRDVAPSNSSGSVGRDSHPATASDTDNKDSEADVAMDVGPSLGADSCFSGLGDIDVESDIIDATRWRRNDNNLTHTGDAGVEARLYAEGYFSTPTTDSECWRRRLFALSRALHRPQLHQVGPGVSLFDTVTPRTCGEAYLDPACCGEWDAVPD